MAKNKGRESRTDSAVPSFRKYGFCRPKSTGDSVETMRLQYGPDISKWPRIARRMAERLEQKRKKKGEKDD